MALSTPDAVFLAILFIVPGFVCSTCISMLVPRRTASSQTRLIEYLTWSCLNFAISGPISVPWLLQLRTALNDQEFSISLLVFLLLFILTLPVAIGLFAGCLSQKQLIALLLGKLDFSTIHPIPNAWDYQFSTRQPSWVIVTTTDNQTIHGLFHEKSFAGESQDNRDIYLEEVYQIDDNEQWIPIHGSTGIWICETQIKAIEFLDYHAETE